MLEHARRYVGLRPWGPFLSFAILSVFAWGAIWAGIEPLNVPDAISLRFPRWHGHLAVSALFGLCGTLVLLVWARSTRLPFDFSYDLDQAGKFYDAIASHYDNRNSPSAIKTHSKIVETIKACGAGKKSMRILDLGGGTGSGVVLHFLDNKDMEWVYVEQSLSMFQKFNSNTSESNLNIRSYLRTIDSYLRDPNLGTFDVVLLSLVLSSMSKDPSWTKITDILLPGGKLIISDIDASYTSIHPFYIVDVDGKKHGFHPRPIPCLLYTSPSPRDRQKSRMPSSA